MRGHMLRGLEDGGAMRVGSPSCGLYVFCIWFNFESTIEGVLFAWLSYLNLH